MQTLRLGGSDPFHLSLAGEIDLDPGECFQHVKEVLAGGGGRVRGLLGGSQGDALALQFMDDVLQVLEAARRWMRATTRVACAREIQRDVQFGQALARGAGLLLSSDYLAAGSLECVSYTGRS